MLCCYSIDKLISKDGNIVGIGGENNISQLYLNPISTLFLLYPAIEYSRNNS